MKIRKKEMKKFSIALIALLLIIPCAVTAQSSKNNKSREVSPFIEGKKKVRETDYDSIWKFTTFDQKKVYYCHFDYTLFPSILEERRPAWGTFDPVMDFLTTQTRTPMRICAIFAINPNMKDRERRTSLIEQARNEALQSIQSLQSWMTEQEMKNKLQLQVAEVDYRYWQGDEYFIREQPTDDIIHVGLILFFGTKKIDLFPSAAANAQTFNNIKFFPNDATVQESYDPMLQQIATYMLDNERFEVLLQGYCDNQGTDAYCLGLSRQRATEVKKKLIALGVPEYRIEVEPMGSADPIGDNNTYEGRIANNRVTIKMQ